MVAGRDAPRFQLWRVLHRMMQFFARNTATFFVLSLITALPAAIFRFEDANSSVPWTLGGPSIVPFFIFALSPYLLCAAITRETLLDLSAKPATPADGFNEVFADLLALLAIAAPAAIASLIGYMLLFLPGLVVDTFLVLVIPLRTVERVSVAEVFLSSIKRTRGYRLPIFALNVVVTAFYFAILMVVNVLTGNMLLDGLFDSSSGGGVGQIWGTIIDDTLLAIVGSLANVSVYYELRLINSGKEASGVASVFD